MTSLRMKVEPGTGGIYFAVMECARSPVKIGHSGNVHERIRHLSGYTPWPLRLIRFENIDDVEQRVRREAELHRQFSDHRLYPFTRVGVAKEWFAYEGALREFLGPAPSLHSPRPRRDPGGPLPEPFVYVRKDEGRSVIRFYDAPVRRWRDHRIPKGAIIESYFKGFLEHLSREAGVIMPGDR